MLLVALDVHLLFFQEIIRHASKVREKKFDFGLKLSIRLPVLVVAFCGKVQSKAKAAEPSEAFL